MPFAATWMDLETIMLSKVSQAMKDKYHIISPIYGIIIIKENYTGDPGEKQWVWQCLRSTGTHRL